MSRRTDHLRLKEVYSLDQSRTLDLKLIISTSLSGYFAVCRTLITFADGFGEILLCPYLDGAYLLHLIRQGI